MTVTHTQSMGRATVCTLGVRVADAQVSSLLKCLLQMLAASNFLTLVKVVRVKFDSVLGFITTVQATPASQLMVARQTVVATTGAAAPVPVRASFPRLQVP